MEYGERTIRGMRKGVRITFIVILVIVFASAAGLYLAAERFSRRDFSEEFYNMRGNIGEAEIVTEEVMAGHVFRTLNIKSDKGISFSASVKAPHVAKGRYPAIIILGGLRTGKRTIDYLKATRNIVILSLDYPYEGKKEKLSALEFLTSLPAIHRAVLETVPAAILGVDYLLGRDDVDPERIILVGGSLGAIFVPAVMAADGRIAAAAMLFGACDIGSLVKSSIDLPAPLPAVAGRVTALMASPVEPLKYVAGVSPRPLFMLNGSEDPRIPPACSRLLHSSAREPKTARWIEAGHLSVQSKEFRERVSGELAKWLLSWELVDKGSFDFNCQADE